MSSIAIGKDVQQCYEAIVAGDTSVSWGIFGYEGQTELKVQASGADDLSEFPDEFSDGKLQYAFLRIPEPNSKLPKFVLIGWCGDGAPRKGVFQQHFSSVASKLTGYHVQITARNEDDISEQSILKKVEDASGAKYSSSNTASLFGPTTSRKPTTNSLVNQLKGQSTPSYNPRKLKLTEPRLPPSASVKPSTVRSSSFANKKNDDWDAPKTDVYGKVQTDTPKAEVQSSRPEPVKSSYQPIGRPDINALRAEAARENPSPSSQDTGTNYQPVEVPKTGSLADRMSAFTGNVKQESPVNTPCKTSNPLASRFGAGSIGTRAAVPTSGPRESKAIGGLAKNFGSDHGKSPAQQWAERKARERGESIPEPVKEAPVKATVYGEDGRTDDHENGISSIKNRLAASSLHDEAEEPKQVSLPPPPKMQSRPRTPETDSEEVEAEAPVFAQHPPPPPNMSSRPDNSSTHPVPSARGPSEVRQEVENEEEEEEEGEEEEAEQVEGGRAASPEPVISSSSKNTFKAQLESAIGGGGATTASHVAAPIEETTSHNRNVESTGPSAKVLYAYEAQEDNEVTLEEDEIVTDIEMIDDGWWSGKNPAGHVGLFPSNYVELIDHDAHATAAPSAHVGHSEASTHTATKHKGSGLCATAVYEYEAAEEGEVGFAEGEMIQEIQQIDEGWWQGKNARGEEGLFPANYVELIS